MKTTLKALIILIVACSFTFLKNDCDTLVFFKEGAQLTMTSYNDDGKLTGTTKTIYSKVIKNADGATVTANQENYNKKGKLDSKNEFTIKCIKGTLFFDMKMMLTEDQSKNNKDFEMTVEGADKEIPTKFVVGSILKDANITITFKTKEGAEVPLSKINFKVTNRKVEAKESITTPAGTFECYKLTENVEMKTLFSFKVKSINWFSLEAGNVKTESYKENGKFISKTELTEIKK